jgi:hypothetical protein
LSLWCPHPAWLGLAVWVQEASATVPVLMIATTGADPSKDLEEFAGRTVGKAAYSELAMGGGQQVRPPPYTPSPSILPPSPSRPSRPALSSCVLMCIFLYQQALSCSP